jgi:hypothetical protein
MTLDFRESNFTFFYHIYEHALIRPSGAIKEPLWQI